MRLNQIIAVEKGVKSKVNADIDGIAKASQKPALFDGFIKRYKAAKEGDLEQVPSETKHIQLRAGQALGAISERWTELFDVTAQKDFANCNARTDVVVDGEVLLKDAPVTYLLFLEKQITDLYTIVSKFPVLDPAEEWKLDQTTGTFRTEPTMTTRTKKEQRAIVLYPHSPEHPAQTQLITEDVPVGTYELTRFSGALPEPSKNHILHRISQLQIAIKAAREQANMTDAPKVEAGAAIFDWVFGKREPAQAQAKT
jgi:hypothetical protein